MTDATAVGFAFTAGAVTFLAPCAYPLLPGYVAYFLGSDAERSPEVGVAGRLRRAAVVGLLASSGFFVVYGVLVGTVVALGARTLEDVAILELGVGLTLVVLGVAMVTGRGSWRHLPLPERRRSASGFVLFGVVYAVAAAGCTAPVFVAVALRGLAGGSVTAVATLGAYAGGMSLLMVAVTVLSALGRDALVRRFTVRSGRLVRVAGALLVVAGVVQVYYYLFEFGGLATLDALVP
ncbi:cytochrome c biogenesis CcdA family protein [Halomicrococcus sp. NG-SE-24]|uniref:cytochrome c biogenesis CcdA family protein n=1 Tax=Halomicrococcus sp. NG-SE-24 TaxID=3436928 RepID=UPI003D9859CD